MQLILRRFFRFAKILNFINIFEFTNIFKICETLYVYKVLLNSCIFFKFLTFHECTDILKIREHFMNLRTFFKFRNISWICEHFQICEHFGIQKHFFNPWFFLKISEHCFISLIFKFTNFLLTIKNATGAMKNKCFEEKKSTKASGWALHTIHLK